MDFRVDPEFQTKLDWMNAFVREEIEPLDLLFPSASDMYDVNNEKARALLKPKILSAVSCVTTSVCSGKNM